MILLEQIFLWILVATLALLLTILIGLIWWMAGMLLLEFCRWSSDKISNWWES